MLSFHQLKFNIYQKQLFDNLSITFLDSAITYIKGANGCGKTSLLRMIAGIMQPSNGNIFYKNLNINNIAKPYCTYIGHNLGLKLEMTVFENLKFWSEIYNSVETLDAAIHYFKLYDLLDEKCYTLSSGLQKVVALARLIACQSDLWLLDEVETNLSKENRDLLNNLIVMKANSGGIVLLSSHTENHIKSAQILQLT
ncbi:heme ABC transporter ATP-binding protein CcmA [Rickettsia bellii]|uniref:Cytochrome c biogenesis ATP-binding export protein CcmA n=3 Tax=Rickettsia bellii TaxID=33990 RepID=CCMA_RICBR|nr:heme ABC exporter ATP-binding protein CcmA [Rickettsia bellii]Q1RKE4.1 RecName: Full=Cytochrome c biogenesis ATP-binding export protein CcmA; AltName: Full=Heme exporter protein A [Rickettsia bellii RML369-C]ABE04170.1 Heme exporter protein A [Rickettsia bellii RML369-C]ARD85951.1 heme ABC transporter ATP-binding protein CcmA [Rickettsia bellii]KJV90604.1 heme ABC exporter, ATP-binding protein CcmA [Rickettsia bellii str. RML An4]KJV92519.1 heme ABC exporter, ATP-binding protein CcmA [Ricke